MNQGLDHKLKGRLTRRGFLTSAGVGALGIATASMFGCAPKNSTAANKDEAKTPSAKMPDITETLNADVVVIGTGVAGLTAAITAAEGGAKVTVLEKLEGLKPVYAHSITAVGTSFQKERGEDWSPEELVAYWNEKPDGLDLIDTDAQLFAAQHSAESIDWLIDHGVDIVGVTLPPTNPFHTPAMTFVTSADRDGVKAYLEPLKAKADELGVEFRFSTEAAKIVVDESGAVSGVEANADGVGTLFNSKSLIVATGGFGSSPELMRLYAPRTPNCPTLPGESTGFALQQAKGVRADIVASGGTMVWFENVDGGYSDNPGQGLFVLRGGKRWVNENEYFLHRAALAFKEGISEYWALYDAPLFDTVAAKTSEKGLETGSIVKADTLEELAVAANINAAALKTSVETYNGYCETGADLDFQKEAIRMGRVFDPDYPEDYPLDLIDKEFRLLNPLATPPFYAINMTVRTSVSGTAGGVRTNNDGAVLDVTGKAIPNLYAVGEAANGHLIGYTYPQSGTSLCMCFCFGRYAGIAAAKNASK